MSGGNSVFLIVLVVAMVALMWWQSHKSKQQQQKVQDFRSSLQPGELVQTIGGVIGKVVSVDTKYEEIVIDSEGSEMRFTFRAISKKYERPAFIDDDEVDEDGNPIVNTDEDEANAPEDSDSTNEQTQSDNQAQKPFDSDDENQDTPVEEQSENNNEKADETSADDAKKDENSGKEK
ncbi:preprotein translocase subunit YajC [Bifidobacterium sp. ESL0732]|uniref:preprotein translocase subunit YajC n=1 Tax=Bifidobacterium sp. ESL0732 TaxID=2983222 RepID=UPI0023F7F6CF|nr:preprotein translocase subunit YajC [Bifidobacterium sp. ESL0732]WEV63268.1 preprotein translocase subunit YajC [Bifidobacterium sp. ESL0732]